MLAGLYGLTGMFGLNNSVQAQDHAMGVPSLLPVPMVQYDYPETQVQYQPAYQVAGRSRQPEAIGDPGLPPAHHGESHGDFAPPPAYAPANGHDVWSDAACQGDGCGDYSCEPRRRVGNCWFVAGYGLAMTRDDSNPVWLSYDQADIDSALLSSRHAEMDWAGGFEVHLGRYFNCGCNAIEAVYWGLFPGEEWAGVEVWETAGGLGSSLAFDGVEYDDGTGPVAVLDIFNTANAHYVARRNLFQNVELNVLGTPSCFSCGDSCCDRPSVQLGWLAGFRYFLFDEEFIFGADEDPYQINVTNQLFGFQIGAGGDFLITQCLRTFANVRMGLFGNSIDHRSQIYGPAGHAYINNPGSSADGVTWDFYSYKADVAFLGELNLGGSWQLCDWARIVGGYRAVALTGVALTTEQIPTYFADVGGVRDIDSNGSLILHGAFAGLELNY
jgi:hypothetical protein